MDPTVLITRIRTHFVDQFRGFIQEQGKSGPRGAAEVKMRLSDQSALFDRLYCVDFLKNPESPQIVEMHPASFLSFEAISGSFGRSALLIEHLHWDDVVLRHDASQIRPEELSSWFRRWFDPDDARRDPAAELCGVIHSLLVKPGVISIDLGTADPMAFWDMLQLLESAGARTITITKSREV